MDDTTAPPALTQARHDFDELVRDVRAELHRYCARMTGSVVDGEDILQDALAKAFYMLPATGPTPHLRAWLFRIAHNKCIDFLRRYDRRYGEPLDEHPMLAEESDALARSLASYVTHFNARNFDALRDLLAEDARLELVGRTSSRGKHAVGSYYSNYDRLVGWRVEVGSVDGRPALIGFEHDTGSRPVFFILIQWRDGLVQSIRDYRYARYTTELARFGG